MTTPKQTPREPSITLPCETCGETVKARASQIRTGAARFCSRKCFQQTKKVLSLHTRHCGQCGAPFVARDADIAKNKAMYCSHACGCDARRKRYMLCDELLSIHELATLTGCSLSAMHRRVRAHAVAGTELPTTCLRPL